MSTATATVAAAAAATPVIQTEGLRKVYSPGTDAEVVALRDVDLVVMPGEFIAIMVPSGSGKSTLMNLIGSLDTPSGARELSVSQDGPPHASADPATPRRAELSSGVQLSHRPPP